MSVYITGFVLSRFWKTDLVLYRFWKIDVVSPRNLHLGEMDEAQCDAAATHTCGQMMQYNVVVSEGVTERLAIVSQLLIPLHSSCVFQQARTAP